MTVSIIDPTDLAKLTARIHELETTIQRVRDLHRGEIASTCAECPDEYGWPLPYPCPTIQALEGDQK